LQRAADSGLGIRFLDNDDAGLYLEYRGLLQRARGLLGYLQQQGLQAGDKLVLFVRNNRAFIDAFWACQLGGLVPVPLSAGVQRAALAKLVQVTVKLEDAWLFSEQPLVQQLRQSDTGKQAFAQRVCLLEAIHELPPAGIEYAADPDDVALIQFSSGSTGNPKGVLLTHANLLANLRAISRAATIDADDCTLSWMPLSHDMGLIGFHLVPLFNGLEQVLMNTGLFIRRPARWLEHASALGATLLCSPNFGYQHYLKNVKQPAASLDLGRVRLIFNGAEPVSAAVCREFLQRLSAYGLREAAMFPVYGLAEAGLAVTFPPPGSGLQSVCVATGEQRVGETVVSVAPGGRTTELVVLGHPLPGCELRITDADGRLLPDNTLGHVQIRGDNVTSGYYHCPDCDRGAFTGDWLDSGDLGLLTGQGLVIAGRAREVIFAAGQNWYPQDLEQILVQAGVVEPGKVAVTAIRSEDNAEDRLWVFIQHRGDHDSFIPKIAATRRVLAADTGLGVQAVVPLPRLPRTTSGKLQRYRLARTGREGGYADILSALESLAAEGGASGSGNPVEQQLLDLCQSRFPGHAIGIDQNLFELGADSLLLVSLHEDINACFPGRLEVTDLFDYPTVRALAAYIGK